ncbi:MAG: tetratricopeptide repeat protein [Thermodesulfovibrionales bacterium]|nr:tetratricopeptide repeat protein [Thermodesulfovibrionales bacterium]
MCIALERGKIAYGLMLCNDAILQEPENPVHYQNLGRIYLKAGRRVDAIETFRKGLSFGYNAEIKLILDNLGTRKKPVFPFLPGNNFLNKYTGLMMHRLKLRELQFHPFTHMPIYLTYPEPPSPSSEALSETWA